MLTKPKLILPFQIARAIQNCFARRTNFARLVGGGSPNRHLAIEVNRRYPILGGELELLARNSAQLEKPDQSFLDQVVRTRRAGRNSDDSRTGWEPEV